MSLDIKKMKISGISQIWMWSDVCQQCPFPEMLSLQVLLRTTVFARMTPDQKTQLVKELQKLK